jgi:hypothetical protein
MGVKGRLEGMEGPLSNYYALLPVSLKIDRLEKAVSVKDYGDFKTLYGEVIDDLDKDFLEIETVKKELFLPDTVETIESNRSDIKQESYETDTDQESKRIVLDESLMG